jgi:hypothetical protein
MNELVTSLLFQTSGRKKLYKREEIREMILRTVSLIQEQELSRMTAQSIDKPTYSTKAKVYGSDARFAELYSGE